MPTYAPPRVMFVRGEGSYLWDDGGTRDLDFLSGLAVTSLGHSHPAVATALHEQAQTLLHTSNLFATPIAPEVATTIDDLIPPVSPVTTPWGRCSSATPGPRRTSARSSSLANGAAAAGTSS